MKRTFKILVVGRQHHKDFPPWGGFVRMEREGKPPLVMNAEGQTSGEVANKLIDKVYEKLR